MRRKLDWLAGAVWGVLVYRLWRRWRQERPAPAPDDVPDDRAEELRARLAESRAAGEEPEAPSEPAAERPESLEERRARVHEEGRAAIDEMRGE